MDRVPVQSSNVASVGYDVSSPTLEVAFHGAGCISTSAFPSVTTSLLQVASLGRSISNQPHQGCIWLSAGRVMRWHAS